MMTSLKHFETTATRWNSETGNTICILANALDVDGFLTDEFGGTNRIHENSRHRGTARRRRDRRGVGRCRGAARVFRGLKHVGNTAKLTYGADGSGG